MARSRGPTLALAAAALLGLQVGLACWAHADPGDLDPSFGSGGRVTTAFPGAAGASAVALQGNGKIVVAGSVYIHGIPDFALARYNADGTLDRSFGVRGRVVTDFADTYDLGEDMALQGNGKIVVAGSVARHHGNSEFALARYNSDGTLDPSFGVGGKVRTTFAGGDGLGEALALQGDGKIVVAGTVILADGTDFAVVRYNQDGALDPSFGDGGKVTTDIGAGDQVNALALQGDGKIVAAGYAATADERFDMALARYNLDGTLNRSFGTAGRVRTDFAGREDRILALALQGNGKILAAGYTASATDASFALVRYNLDGSLNQPFGIGGKVGTGFPGALGGAVARAVALQGDGKMVAAGYAASASGTDLALARYLLRSG